MESPVEAAIGKLKKHISGKHFSRQPVSSGLEYQLVTAFGRNRSMTTWTECPIVT